MKCLLCSLEGIYYALRVEDLLRIEESARGGPPFHPWQVGLGGRGKRRAKADFSGILHLRGPGNLVLYVDDYSEIVELPDDALTTFPAAATALPADAFAGVFILDDGPRILLNPGSFPAPDREATR